ncbi:MAG: hypothetical protein ACI9LX_001222 [Paraglaciecola sp.]|jgi:hypothetical protein
MKKRLLLGFILLALTSSAGAYFVSLDSPQDFPINI